MNFKPILFSTEMVKAILSGSKVQTRRVVKEEHAPVKISKDNQYAMPLDRLLSCPYGQVGDVLWVRENYLKPPKVITSKMLKDGADTWPSFDYQADCELGDVEQYKEWGWKMKPSIHMPKEACRLFLKIKSIRVERLRDISEADAVYEGIEVIHFAEPSVPIFKRYDLKEKLGTVNPIFSFESLWQKINGRQSLINNPWVWVIEFERIEKPENF